MPELRTMKVIAAGLGLLAAVLACSLPGSAPAAVPSPTLVIATATKPPTAVPSDTPVPPTPVPPSATPIPPEIGVGTIGRLAIASTFGQGEALRSLAFSPDGTVLASAGGNDVDFAIRIWDVSDGSLLRTLDGHTGIVWTVAFSPDGGMLASVSSDGTAKIWDWRTGEVLESLAFPNEVVSVTFSPDGQLLAVGGVDGFPNASVWVYDVPSWHLVRKLAEFWNIPALVFSPDGQFLVGGGTSRNVRIWRISDGLSLFTLSHSGQVSTLAISPDGSTIASGLCEASGDAGSCTRGAVWYWDLQTGRQIRKLSDFTEWVENVAYSVDGSLLIAGVRDGRLRFIDTSTDQTRFTASSPGGGGILALSPDGRSLATTGANGKINLWKIGP